MLSLDPTFDCAFSLKSNFRVSIWKEHRASKTPSVTARCETLAITCDYKVVCLEGNNLKCAQVAWINCQKLMNTEINVLCPSLISLPKMNFSSKNSIFRKQTLVAWKRCYNVQCENGNNNCHDCGKNRTNTKQSVKMLRKVNVFWWKKTNHNDSKLKAIFYEETVMSKQTSCSCVVSSVFWKTKSVLLHKILFPDKRK